MNNMSKFPLEMRWDMELRDDFAGRAMQAAMTNSVMWGAMMKDRRGIPPLEYVAQESYKMADAMLKERKKVRD